MASGIVLIIRSTSSETLKLMIDVDNLSGGLWIAAIVSELHVEDHAVDTNSDFFANKILQEGFFDNPSNGIVDHHSKLPFI